ncbi:MAG: DUF3097 domain-containing protein [Geodermatophilaceae bacterium]|nr:DUF3097 domain-containing protein [Geodermatophilaceae bacterium]
MPRRFSGSADRARLVHDRARRPAVTEVPADLDLVVEEPGSDFCGAIVGCAADAVHLEDRHGRVRVFPLTMTFLLQGHPVRLIRARPAAPDPRRLRSASGSTVLAAGRASVARASRIYVEGIHDAELVEKVWGHDLRVEGVVVEPLHGIDDLPSVVRDFGPAGGRKLGVLVDHLVPGSKESRIAGQVVGSHVLVVGHPYVDIWQAIRPEVLGIRAWPEVPRGRPWKDCVCEMLGWGANTGATWQHILARVHSYVDLEPTLLGRVEELIDFVTAQD